MLAKSLICNAEDTSQVIECLRDIGFTEVDIDLILSDFRKIAVLRHALSSVPEQLDPKKEPVLFKNTITSICRYFPVLQIMHERETVANEKNKSL